MTDLLYYIFCYFIKAYAQKYKAVVACIATPFMYSILFEAGETTLYDIKLENNGKLCVLSWYTYYT